MTAYGAVRERPIPLYVHSLGRYAVAPWMTVFDGDGAGAAAWPTANRAIYCPIVLPRRATIARFFVANNSITGNDDVGIYTDTGSLIISTGSQARTAALDFYDVTDTALGPGRYYLALASNNTGNHFRATFTQLPVVRMAGLLQEASAFPLPSTMTGVAMASAYHPLFGFTQSGTI